MVGSMVFGLSTVDFLPSFASQPHPGASGHRRAWLGQRGLAWPGDSAGDPLPFLGVSFCPILSPLPRPPAGLQVDLVSVSCPPLSRGPGQCAHLCPQLAQVQPVAPTSAQQASDRGTVGFNLFILRGRGRLQLFQLQLLSVVCYQPPDVLRAFLKPSATLVATSRLTRSS